MTGRVIVITSGKGGVGKTTTNANIGTALARAGNKVVMIDTDLGLRNLDLLLGLENRIVYTIVDVVEERCKLKQALVKDKKNPNLCLLAAAQTRDKSAVSAEQLKEICDQLKEKNDFTIVILINSYSWKIRIISLGVLASKRTFFSVIGWINSSTLAWRHRRSIGEYSLPWPYLRSPITG